MVLCAVHHVSHVHKLVPGAPPAQLCLRVAQDNLPPGNRAETQWHRGTDPPNWTLLARCDPPAQCPRQPARASHLGRCNSPSWAELHPLLHKTPHGVCWAETQQPRSAATQLICSPCYWGAAEIPSSGWTKAPGNLPQELGQKCPAPMGSGFLSGRKRHPRSHGFCHGEGVRCPTRNHRPWE